MVQAQKKNYQFYLSRKMVIVVALFFLLSSGMVVLTDKAINMIAATRDYTALVTHWSQTHQEKFDRLFEYIQTGQNRNYQQYIKIVQREKKIRTAVTELFKSSPDAKKVFEGFSNLNINPNEISALLTAFQGFQNLSRFVDLNKTWTKLEQRNIEISRLAESLYKNNQDAEIAAIIAELKILQKEIPELSYTLLNDIGEISLFIKRIALWISVILGILLVLTGIVFSVRGWKSVNRWEEVLKERDYLAGFPELNPNPVLQIDRNGTVNFANPATLKLFPDIKAKGFAHPFLTHIMDIFELTNGKSVQSFQEVVNINGVYYQQQIHYVKQGDCVHVHSQNVTEKVKSEQKIKMSLKEKEVLLSEIHHRVKNNLAVISGLLEIQNMNGSDPQKALQESQSRIHSMAMIHEILYQSDSFSEINLSDYMNKLIDHICTTYGAGNENISICTNIDEVIININQAIPCGLILNELLSNAIQHAFDNSSAGEISVQLKEAGRKVHLMVKDNGKGLPEDLDLENAGSTGFTIVQALITQLHASVHVDDDSGTGFTITFAKSDAPGSSNATF